MNLLLQILDEGKSTTPRAPVNFENTVICMTSNAGSSDKTGETGFNRTIAQMSRIVHQGAGRISAAGVYEPVDEIVTFAPPSESLKRIAALMLGGQGTSRQKASV
ncbi:MAG: AAA family ATPase [Ruthenibacterium lactatiformans]